MKKVIKSILGVSLSFGLSGVAYATGETLSTDTTVNTGTTCYAVSDDAKEIYVIHPDSTNVTEATIISTSGINGNTKGKYNGEASAFNTKLKQLYLFNNPSLGSTDDDHKFDLYSVDISEPSNPKQRIIERDFIDFEPTGAEYYNEKLYVIKEGSQSTLYIYNTKTWEVESQLEIEKKISGFAINPSTGEAYVMDDRDKNPTEAAELFKLDLTTGILTSVAVLSNDDFDGESLAFGGDGKLYTENERKEEKRSIYEISTSDASVRLVAYLPGDNNVSQNDIESIACTSNNHVNLNPTTDDKVNPEMLNSLGAVNILNLSGKDRNGIAIESFTILSLPTENQGLLYMEDTATLVEVNQTLTLAESNELKFDPSENFEGNVTFIYASVDINGLVGNEATVTIPLISGGTGEENLPTAENQINQNIPNTLGAVDILNLSGKDTDGKSTTKFIITSLPSVEQGTLYLADAKTPVTLNQELTIEEANGLKFNPKEGYVGDAIFNYRAIDTKGVKGEEATVTIPVVSEGDEKKAPITDDKINPKILNTSNAINIVNLSGTNSEGNPVENFVILSLPSVDTGVLYLADGKTPVTVNQKLSVEESNGLKFDPEAGFEGNALFTYQSVDSKNVRGTIGSVTLPIVSVLTENDKKPITDNRLSTELSNSMGATNIANLLGTDLEGNAVENFVITSLPSAEQGILYMADGKTPVTVNQELTLEEANGLKFDPKEGFVGNVTFNYRAIDAQGVKGDESTISIPVVRSNGEGKTPKADSKSNDTVSNNLGAIDIVDLSATDAEGNATKRFVITSLPSAEQGVLYMTDGKTPVTVNQELTLDEANGLKFDPKEGFVGDATFNYVGLDTNNVKGAEGTVTIPVIDANNNKIPTTDNKKNPEILNSVDAVNITNLSGTDAEGNAVEKFVITSLPSAEQGVLYMADGKTLVTVNQELSLEEANGLKFDPKAGFVGDVVFNYTSVDSKGLKGKEASVTIPVVTEHKGEVKPISDNRVNPEVSNTMGAVNITDLSGTDTNGTAIERFVITSLPSEEQGILFMANGTTPITEDQELTLEEANGLRFDPKAGFVGEVTFTYVGLDSNGTRGEDGTVTIPVIGTALTTECVCEDYTESIPVLSGFTSIFMLLLSSFIGMLFTRKED